MNDLDNARNNFVDALAEWFLVAPIAVTAQSEAACDNLREAVHAFLAAKGDA